MSTSSTIGAQGAALLLTLALLAGCGAAPPLTATPPTPPPTAVATATAGGPASPAPVATSTASPVSTPAATATAGSPGTPTTAATRPATPTASPATTATAELLRIEGQPVTQLAIADAGHRYATTPVGLFALTGEQVERRGGAGSWPNLVAVGPTTLISGERMSCGRGDGGVALRRSVDGGRTWQPAQALAGSGSLRARPIPTLGNTLFAIACDGLYRSTDGGGAWARLAILAPDSEPVDVATTPDGARLFIVTLVGEGGTTRLVASERQGDTWAPARVLRESWGGGVVGVGAEAGRLVVFFGHPLGLEVSRDGGATWSALNAGLDSTRLLEDPRAGPLSVAEEAKLRRGVGIYSLSPRLDRPEVLLGGGDGVYRLSGATWQKLPVLTGQIVREVFHDLDGTAYARTDVGVHRLRGI